MSFQDGRELDEGTVLRAEVCIIGAGAAGITLARTLGSSGRDVILLESGGFEPDDATQDLARGELVGEPMFTYVTPIELHQLRLRYFGGTTNHWAGYCRPLEEVDFETRPYLAVSGWPFGRGELTPWYDRATEVIRLRSTSFDLADWADAPGMVPPLVQTPEVTTSVFQVKYPFNFGAAYRDELEASSTVRVVLWSNVTSIDAAPESDRIESVTVRTLEGRSFRVEASVFVSAMGGIENARVLLASNEVRTAGLGNQNDLVGRHFTEHLQALGAVVLLRRTVEESLLYNGVEMPGEDGSLDRTIALKGALTLTREALLDRELLGLEAQLLVAEPRPGGPEYANGLRAEDVRPLLEAVQAGPGTTAAFLQVLAEQELDPDSRVRLGTTRDALGMPKIELDWRHSERDRASIQAGLRLIARELGRLQLGRVQIATGAVSTGIVTEEGGPLSLYSISPDETDLVDFPLGIGFHHMCTTRMADDPTRGVVDADGRVHGLGNLFVAGSSVFATGGVATPTLTITALALRLADHLDRRVLG